MALLRWHAQVVDERMWGEEDAPEEGQRPGEEKFERNAPVQVLTFRHSARAVS